MDPKKRPTAREIVDYLHPGKHGSDHSLPHLPSAEDRTEEQAAKTVELKTRYEEFFQSVITKLTVLDDAGIPTKIDDETLASLHKELEELKQEMGSLMGEISGVCEKDSHCSEVENKQLEKLAQEERIREEEAAASKASKGDGTNLEKYYCIFWFFGGAIPVYWTNQIPFQKIFPFIFIIFINQRICPWHQVGRCTKTNTETAW